MPTIKDVARASGVSISTASYALNNGPRTIPADTRARVLQAARQIGYHPSAVARGLQRKRMNTLGVVFSNPEASPIANPYFAPILDGIVAAAAQYQQNAMLFTGQRWSNAEHSLPVFGDGRCDGLLLVGPHTHSDIIPSLIARGIPFVLINNRWGAAAWVDVDDVAAAHMLTSFLLAQGHHRLAMLCGDAVVGCVERRLAGCRDALAEAGLALDPALVLPGSFLEPSINERLVALVRLPPARRPTALICSNDFMALDALRDLARLGIRVPADLSVAGFDDVAPSAVSDPPLTTVRQPLRLLGERAVETLLKRIAGDPHEAELLLSTELIVRQSTAGFAG